MAIQVRLEPAVLTLRLWKAHYTTFFLPVLDCASSIFDRNELKLRTDCCEYILLCEFLRKLTVKALDLPTKPNAAVGLFSSSAVLGAVLPQVLAARPARRRHLGARMKLSRSFSPDLFTRSMRPLGQFGGVLRMWWRIGASYQIPHRADVEWALKGAKRTCYQHLFVSC